ncbi:MAG: DUF788 domain-containing protein [Methanobacteriaceae archaeon]
MKRFKLLSYLILIISILSIGTCILFSVANWIVYGVAIVFIPLFILSLGLVTMGVPKKDEEDERREEPFIGY